MATTTDMAPGRKPGNGNGNTGTTSGSDSTAGKAREQELEAQVAQLQEDLKSITETVSKLTGNKVDEVKALAKSEMRHLKSKGEAMLSDAQGQAEEVEKQLKDMIREKPLTAVAAAAGIGFVFALLTRH